MFIPLKGAESDCRNLNKFILNFTISQKKKNMTEASIKIKAIPM